MASLHAASHGCPWQKNTCPTACTNMAVCLQPQGIPPHLREHVWMAMSGAAKRRDSHHPSYYMAMRVLGRLESPFVHQIELVRLMHVCRPACLVDLEQVGPSVSDPVDRSSCHILALQDVPRTFPNNVLMRTEEGQNMLRRVLFAFARHKPDVGYCQGMNYIAALLLLSMNRNEESSFWVLASLIDDGGREWRTATGNWCN